MSYHKKPTLVVLWPRFGPYHCARLTAAERLFGANGWAVAGVEAASADRVNSWHLTSATPGRRPQTLFSKTAYEDVPIRRIAGAIRDILVRIDPQAVAIDGWSFAEALAALSWCRSMGRCAICMSESKADDAVRSGVREFIKRRLVRAFDAALVGGGPHADYISALGLPRDRVAMGYDVVDNDWFIRGAAAVRAATLDRRSKYGLPEHYFYANARLIPRKNIDRLIEAYAAYASQIDHPWALVVTGDGPCRNDLLRRCAELNLSVRSSPRMASGNPGESCAVDPSADSGEGWPESNSLRPAVCWPGAVQYDELPVFYGLASAFIMPSVQDQWGLVVNEAMASGLPILASRTAGCRYELMEDGQNGYLLDPFSVEDMATAMTRMSILPEDKRTRMGWRSREVIAHWGPERFADGLWKALQYAGQPQPSRTVLERIGFRLCIVLPCSY